MLTGDREIELLTGLGETLHLLERIAVALEAIARRLGEPPRPPQEEPRHTP